MPMSRVFSYHSGDNVVTPFKGFDANVAGADIIAVVASGDCFELFSLDNFSNKTDLERFLNLALEGYDYKIELYRKGCNGEPV